MKKVLVLSPFYNYSGHFKEIADSFLDNKDDNIKYFIALIGKTNVKKNTISISVFGSKFGNLGALKKYLPFSIYFEQLLKYFFNLIFLLKCKKYFKDFDHVYFYDYEYFSLITFLNFITTNLKISICIHSSNIKKSLIYNFYKKIFFKILKKKENNFSNIFVNDHKIKNDLITYGFDENKVKKIQFFINDEKYFKVSKDIALKKMLFNIELNKKIIIIFGLLRKDKNIYFSLNLIKQLNNCHLIIAGSDGDISGKEIKNYIYRNEIKNVTLINKYLNYEEISYIYSIADLYLFNYHIDFNSQSGPVTLCRFFEIPVVAYKNSSIGNYITKYNLGIVSEDFTVKEFKKTIIETLNNNNKILKIKKNIKYHSEQFSTKSAFKKYANFF